MSQPLYIFDMDDTLIDGDTSMLWNEFLFAKGLIADPDFLRRDKELMGLYAIGKMDMEQYLQFAMTPILELSTQEVDRLVDEYVETDIMRRVFPQAHTLIDELTHNQIPMLIISATVSFIVKAVAKRLGIEHALGIDMKVEHGRYTAKIEGIPSYREGKVLRLQNWLKEHSASVSATHFYTDSINDLPLCQQSDYAYLINPDPLLAEYAHTPNWHVLSWSHEPYSA
ncbi:HAD family hydrolase [Vibrio porteresiae]|uniref:HAD family hydrolase n=1 Tax=Vibrio porteresiae DSM 19223 TaxID=1123496 RepID=A0ABZ0QMC0_9VIBR|nr:HAD family hydrolase [Vibrio porteresiae]WPC76837.1 HAD family hydrolase [Vibrio porteresiae DSM 19223]